MSDDQQLEALTQSIDEIVDNMRAVKGDKFCDVVMFAFMARQQMKLHATLVGMMMDNSESDKEATEWAQSQGAAFCSLSSAMLALHFRAHGLKRKADEALVEEALALADQLFARVSKAEAKINGR